MDKDKPLDDFWDLHNFRDKDIFAFAPPPPENGRDPWVVLLEPLLKKDGERCAIWKDEVQNLLIFAGLFSAVVTAFLVESYKRLQADPQDQIVALLSQIALRLDGGNATSPGKTTEFVPDSTSIRINSLWFLSLVLSLTTVLVGIVSLQWLREHQNYSELTPKNAFAVIRMRTEGLRKWHVSEVFVGLPVLLQTALVLFLVGLVDFVRPFGAGIVVPVDRFIGLTLLFLLATTVLPTLQGLAFYLPFRFTNSKLYAPSQCPYKSPQSRAFRVVLRFAFRICDRLHWYAVRKELLPLRLPLRKTPKGRTTDFSRALRLVRVTYNQKSRQGYDLSWISLRDAFSRETFDSTKNGSELDASTLQSLSTKIPMFDVALGVCEAAKMHHKRGEEDQLSAAYHCFSDLARSIADRFNSTKYNYFGQTRRYEGWHVFRHFEAIIGHDPDRRLPLFDYLALPYYGIFDAAMVSQENQERSNLLYHELIAMFLDSVPHPKFRVHLAEVLIRVMTRVYGPGKKHDLLPTSLSLNSGDEPLCMSMHALETEVTRTIPKSGILHIDSVEFQMLLQQYANVFRKFFECAGSIRDMEDKSTYMVVHTGVHIPEFMWSAYTLFSDTSYRELLLKDVKGAENAFTAIIDTIQNQLDTFLIDRPSSANDQASNLNVLFYTATLFVRRLHTIGVHEDSLIKRHIREKINDIIPTLAMYKRKILDVHGPAVVLEERYGGTDRGIPRFTQEWWEFLDSRSSDYGH